MNLDKTDLSAMGTVQAETDWERPWAEMVTPIVLGYLRRMTSDERREIFEHFCLHCMDEQPDGRFCQCWNDE